MKRIDQLEKENNELKAKLADTKSKIDELTAYLSSKKFHCGNSLDGYVNTQDVLDQLRDIRVILLI